MVVLESDARGRRSETSTCSRVLFKVGTCWIQEEERETFRFPSYRSVCSKYSLEQKSASRILKSSRQMRVSAMARDTIFFVFVDNTKEEAAETQRVCKYVCRWEGHGQITDIEYTNRSVVQA